MRHSSLDTPTSVRLKINCTLNHHQPFKFIHNYSTFIHMLLQYSNKAGGIVSNSVLLYLYRIHRLLSTHSDTFLIHMPQLCPTSQGKQNSKEFKRPLNDTPKRSGHHERVTLLVTCNFAYANTIRHYCTKNLETRFTCLSCSWVNVKTLKILEDWYELGCSQTLFANKIACCKLRF